MSFNGEPDGTLPSQDRDGGLEVLSRDESGFGCEFLTDDEYLNMYNSFEEITEVEEGRHYREFDLSVPFENAGAITCTIMIAYIESEKVFVCGHYVNYKNALLSSEDGDAREYDRFLSRIKSSEGNKSVYLFGENSHEASDVIDDFLRAGVKDADFNDMRMSVLDTKFTDETSDNVIWNPDKKKFFVFRGDWGS